MLVVLLVVEAALGAQEVFLQVQLDELGLSELGIQVEKHLVD